MTEIDTSRERLERLQSIGCADYLHMAILARAEKAEARRDELDALLHEGIATDADTRLQARNAALREAALWCSDEADRCADAAKWGGHRKYVANCTAADFALKNAEAHILALIDTPAPDHIPDAGKMVPVQQAAKALLRALHSCDTEAQAIADRIAGPVGCLPSIPDAVQVLDDAETIIRAALRALAGEPAR